MKKIFAVLLVLAMVTGLAGCAQEGVSQEEYERVVAERDALKAELDAIKNPPTPEPVPEPEYKFRDSLSNVVISTSKPNSVGGVDVAIDFRNLFGTIKYITFVAVPYNAVDDAVESEIGGESSTRLQFTGPVGTDKKTGGLWRNAWYNNSIKNAKITRIEIEYMDGTLREFDEGEFSYGKGIFSADNYA